MFRYRGGRPSEFLQAGIESFGRQDRAAADAEMLALALEATAAFGVEDVEIRTGDVALFTALIDALDLYPVWRRRLIKDFNRKVSLTDDIERLTLATAPGRNEYEGVLAALAGSDRKAALALVTDLMSIAGTTNVGGRTVAEIADRFLEQSTLKGGALPRDALDIIKRFLAIAGDPDESAGATARAGHRRQARSHGARSTSSKAASASWPRAASTPATCASPPRSAAGSITTPASNSNCTRNGQRRRAAGRGRALRRPDDAARCGDADPRGRLLGVDRGADAARTLQPQGSAA